MRIQLPSALVTPLLSAVGRLEINFDPRVGLRRVQRYGWQWKRDAQYAFLISVSVSRLSERVGGRARGISGSNAGVRVVTSAGRELGCYEETRWTDRDRFMSSEGGHQRCVGWLGSYTKNWNAATRVGRWMVTLKGEQSPRQMCRHPQRCRSSTAAFFEVQKGSQVYHPRPEQRQKPQA